MFKTEKQATKSQAGADGTGDLNAKINLLAENVQSLLDRNQTIDEEIKSVKSNVQSMTNQILQINVSSTINHVFTKNPLQENLNGTFTYASSCDEYFQQGNRSNGSFLIRPNPVLGSKLKLIQC